MIRRLLFVCIALLAAAALTGCGPLGPLASGHLDIGAAELQARLAPRFPARHCKTIIVCIELSNPQVVLHEGDDRVGLVVDVRIALGPRERSGRIGLAGRPRYDPGQGQLFLDDLEVTTLEWPDLPAEYVDWVKLGGTLAVRKALQDHPLYTLDDSSARNALARRTVSDVTVVDGRLRVTFGGAAP